MNLETSKNLKAFLICLYGLVTGDLTFGARFPDAIEREIVITGEEATVAAELFDISSNPSISIKLRLGRGDAWAIYLLKQDTKERLFNDNNGSPARYNVIKFSPLPVPLLAISPYWLDLATRLPNPKVGCYEFSSPFIAKELDQKDAWTNFVLKLKGERAWSNSGRIHFQRRFKSSDGTELSIEVFHSDDYSNAGERSGYQVTITANLKK